MYDVELDIIDSRNVNPKSNESILTKQKSSIKLPQFKIDYLESSLVRMNYLFPDLLLKSHKISGK